MVLMNLLVEILDTRIVVQRLICVSISAKSKRFLKFNLKKCRDVIQICTEFGFRNNDALWH